MIRNLILVLNRNLILILIPRARVTLRARIANHLVMDSYCRGGIVNTRCVYSGVLVVPLLRPKALWRFRASTSNSLIGRTWPPADTLIRHIHHTYAQQDIRVCGDDHI